MIIYSDLVAQVKTVPDKFRSFGFKLHAGGHLYTGEQLSEMLENGYAAIELRYGWQSKGSQDWQKEHGYPTYGIGWYTGYIGDPEIFGNPNALFGFISFPLNQGRRNNFLLEPALGLTYNLKPYDPDNNSINDAIGAKLAVYFCLHAGGRYQVNREIDLLYGLDLTHFSNGRINTPNMGLNMIGLSVGAAYNFNTSQKVVDKSRHPSTILEVRPVTPQWPGPRRLSENNITLYQAFGTVQNIRDAGTDHRYLTSSTVLEYQHKFNTKHGLTVGFDAFVDPSARDTVEYTANKTEMENFFPGAHAGYDFMFWRLSIRLQVGVHLSSIGRELKGTTFVRPALRFDISKRFNAQIGLKTFNGAQSDWVEWGFGYKIFVRQHH
ncbi:hypothetical protein OI18_09275 [Flavihumibacter solisilvae]|uniref:Deacylase n=2 Tax=Flavihumibacter solisilvae TaxID=1349421 RepID=A0A0C1IX96_9BACT|nr:hypothetical protein OI18_09275 [Flavihumibacter solisilvae]